AAAIIGLAGAIPPASAYPGQLRGSVVRSADVATALPAALDAGLDLLLLDGTAGIEHPWPELAGAPDLTVIRDALRLLRELNREEDVELVWFGGVRSGTDTAKLIGLGANAVAVSTALALAAGGRIEGDAIAFYGDTTPDERAEGAELYLQAVQTEASIMPRCTGKTNLANVEPEDLRSISLVTAVATGIPLAGRNERLAAAG
ncbi:MAG: glutamate synthase, partial [Actinobacteria bacterium]|nr:glutamate synthase [Actinomycetota bacterium]